MKRWQDKNIKVSNMVMNIYDMDRVTKDNVLNTFISHISNTNQEILSKIVFGYNKSKQKNRRWYDHYDEYPKMWLLYNILSYSKDDLLDEIISTLDNIIKQETKKK